MAWVEADEARLNQFLIWDPVTLNLLSLTQAPLSVCCMRRVPVALA